MNPAFEHGGMPAMTKEEEATAPPPEALPSYADYGQPGQNYLPPPPPPSYDAAVNDAEEWFAKLFITEEEAIDALRKHIKKLCCWGEGPLNEIKIQSVEPSTAYKYFVYSWNENRNTEWKHEPFMGGMIDGEFNGPPPAPWSIPCVQPAEFTHHVYQIRVPHTENVRTCHNCFGRGRKRCTWCHGYGHKDCTMCNGGRRPDDTNCHTCNGSGRKRCLTCHGRGWVICATCNGCRQLKHFLLLIVTFHTHANHYVHEESDLPNELILKAEGQNMFQETAERIGPILNFNVQEINNQSHALINSHTTSWPHERMWKQKQVLDSVPVYEILYKMSDNETGRFWVYGNQKLVFTDDYPAQCCCCCNLPGLCSNCSCCNTCNLL